VHPKAEDGERRASPVDLRRSRRVTALVHESQRQHEHHHGDGDVQEERRAPSDVFDQPAAGHRSDCGGDGAESRPRANRPTTFGVVERGADDREAPGNEKGRANTLNSAAGNEHRWRGCEATADGGDGEQHHTQQEHALASELIAERSSHEDQCAQEERVGLDHPLHVRDRRPEVSLERRQRDVDHGGIDEGQA
jgi:hypothetical protein